MVKIRTIEDIMKNNDPELSDFLRKYAIYLVPRETPIKISKNGDTIKVGDYLVYTGNKFYITGTILGEKVYHNIDERLAKQLLVDYSDATELAYAVALTSGYPVMFTKKKLYGYYEKLVIIFTIITNNEYYVLTPDGPHAISKLEHVKNLVKNAKKYTREDFDYTFYGQSAIAYIKQNKDFFVTVSRSHKIATLTIHRDVSYFPGTSGEVIYTTQFDPVHFETVLDFVAGETDACSIISTMIGLTV